MSTIEIILAVAVFLILLGTWDNSGRIDRLQRQKADKTAKYWVEKEKNSKNPMARNLLGVIDNLETTVKMQNSQIKDLNAELNKTKFEYAKQVVECTCGKN